MFFQQPDGQISAHTLIPGYFGPEKLVLGLRTSKKEVYRAKMHSYEGRSPFKPISSYYSEKLRVDSVFSLLVIFGPPKGSARNRAETK